MQSTSTQQTYAEWLKTQMEERGLTLRGLARNWKPEDPETARRALRRYLKGSMAPIVRTRLEIATALGADQSGPAADDEKEGD